MDLEISNQKGRKTVLKEKEFIGFVVPTHVGNKNSE
jgi:hypothetical protein